MAYEVYTAVYGKRGEPSDYAPAEELGNMYDHLKNSLETLGMRQWNEGDNYMKSLRRVFSRTRLERRDVATIHKLCGEIDKFAHRERARIEKEIRISASLPDGTRVGWHKHRHPHYASS